MKRSEDDGFTLIELLVVMIIIGILAAIAIPAFLSQQNKARATTQKNDLIAMVTDVQSILVDGTAPSLTFDNNSSNTKWTITGTDANGSPVSPTGNLSPQNTVDKTASTYSGTTGKYCIQIKNSKTNQSWKYDTRTGGASTPVQGTC